MAAFHSENEKPDPRELAALELEHLEAGKPIGAVLTMSEQAQRQLRDSIELIDFLVHQDDVTWN